MEYNNLQGFSDVARDHAMRPRNYGPLDAYDGHGRITGPCGETMEFWIQIQDGIIRRVTFSTDGCGSSLACGSMVTRMVEGRPLEEVCVLQQNEILNSLAGLPAEYEHCALLAANTFKVACEDYRKQRDGFQEEPRVASGQEGSGGGNPPPAGGGKQGRGNQQEEDRRALRDRLNRIKFKIVILSGKGGVGKSTVAVNLATALALEGKRVGLLDVDVHGPSIPTMLGLPQVEIRGTEEGMYPVQVGEMKVMSLGFLLQNPDDAVIWRGPMKTNVIKQFLKDVIWGDLDFLIIDSPPGTGDEPLSVCQLVDRLDGAVIVTTPQKVAAVDVRKSITFCRSLNTPVLGVVENMSGFACPHCGTVTQILRSGGGEVIARDMKVPYLGSIPMDPAIAESCDLGKAFLENYASTPTARIMRDIVKPIVSMGGAAAVDETTESKPEVEPEPETKPETKEVDHMKIAIPLAEGKLALHFGHCESFAIVEVDPVNKKILGREDLNAPPHQPGLLPTWLSERGANLIIAGGMGQRAQDLFTHNGIQVLVGASPETPEKLAADYLEGTLTPGDNICDH